MNLDNDPKVNVRLNLDNDPKVNVRLNLKLLDHAHQIERFTLYDIVTYGKIISVYDGDTFDMSFIVPMKSLTTERSISKRKKGTCLICENNYESSILMRMKCRMENINAPELDTPEGVVAKENLDKILRDRIVQCRLGTYDKYGRVLVTILEEDENLKEHLKLHLLKNII
jgi:endonuclease YncB( thermonuclease family)